MNTLVSCIVNGEGHKDMFARYAEPLVRPNGLGSSLTPAEKLERMHRLYAYELQAFQEGDGIYLAKQLYAHQDNPALAFELLKDQREKRTDIYRRFGIAVHTVLFGPNPGDNACPAQTDTRYSVWALTHHHGFGRHFCTCP